MRTLPGRSCKSVIVSCYKESAPVQLINEAERGAGGFDEEPTIVSSHQSSWRSLRRTAEQTFPGVYHGYFENQNGEQAVFVYDYEQERGTLYVGDARWEHPYDVEDGKIAGLMLNRPEQLWLSACWEASGALKAVREQIREGRRREHE